MKIPKFILRRFEKNSFQGDLSCYTVFIDLSGFTKMSQDLMQYNKEGSELLCRIINRVFSPAIRSIHHNGGFITTFAGDAFTALFDKNRVKLPYVLKACQDINARINQLNIIKSKFGKFPVSVKIGISQGRVEWKILDTDSGYKYYFRGEGIDNAAYAEHKAGQNDIIIDKQLLNKILDLDRGFEYAPVEDKHIRLMNFTKIEKDIEEAKFTEPRVKSALSDGFLPKHLRELNSKGEFREILSLFISFKEEDEFTEGIFKTINLAEIYGAYLKQIDFGDKGGTLLFFFGAPVAVEKLFERASNFALDCLKIKELKCKMGLAFGKAFTGFIGSRLRSEYGALGNVVNKSARLAMETDWNEIKVDEIVYHKVKTKFILDHKGSKFFKGFDEKIDHYNLIKKKIRHGKKDYRGRLFARESELKFLMENISELKNKCFQGLIYINGDPGTGKTRLLHELKKKISDKFFWAYMPCDPIIRNSFNPLKYFLRVYFDYSDDLTEEENRSNFEIKLRFLISSIGNSDLKKELERTISVLGSLLGINYPDSLYNQLSSKDKYSNIIYSVKNLLKSLSLLKPLIIELDDGQWIDSDTLVFLSKLGMNIDSYPIIILSECRYKDDGERIDFNLENIKTESIDLKYFDIETTRSFILDYFNSASIPEETLGYIYKYSSGNPFFLEQILCFIFDNNLIGDDGHVIFDKINIPTDINSLIIARIDRLSENLKDLIRTASVLGVEFPVKLLENMLSGKNLEDRIKKIEHEQIWIQVTQLTYLFKHALIRESVYQIQLKERLKKLHNLAAQAIKSIYKEKIEAYYPVLADHYEKAEDIKEAMHYIKLSINSFKKEFKNKKALEFYDKLYRYTKSERKKTEIDLSKMQLLNNMGKIKESEILGKKALDKAKKKKYRDLIIIANLQLGQVNLLKYDLDKSLKHLNYAVNKCKNNSMQRTLAQAYKDIGLNYSYRGYSDKALEYYQKALAVYEKLDDNIGTAGCSNDIAIFCGRQIGLDKVLDLLFYSYNTYKEINDINMQLVPLSNIALTYYEVYLDIEKSNSYYEQAIEIAEKLGSYKNLMILFLNLGANNIKLQNFNRALELLNKSIILGTEMNNKAHISQCYSAMCEIYLRQNDLNKALAYIDKSIDIIKDKKLNLLLIDHKSNKFDILIELKRYNEAFELFTEIKRSGEQFNIKHLDEQIKIFEYKIKYLLGEEKTLENLIDLADSNPCKDNEALIYDLLWQITKEDKYRLKALELYRSLVDNITEDEGYKNYSYIERLNELDKKYI